MHPFWSSITGSFFACPPSLAPSLMYTTQFFTSPFSPTTQFSSYTGSVCCLAQSGTAFMLIAFGLGGVPSNVTFPVTSANADAEHNPTDNASADNHIRLFIGSPCLALNP